MTDLPFSLDRLLSRLVNKSLRKAGYHLLEFDETKIVCVVANLISCMPRRDDRQRGSEDSLAFLR